MFKYLIINYCKAFLFDIQQQRFASVLCKKFSNVRLWVKCETKSVNLLLFYNEIYNLQMRSNVQQNKFIEICLHI